MSSVAAIHDDHDVTDVPLIARGAIILGVIESVFVVIFSMITRFLPPLPEAIVGAIALIIGLSIVAMLPGLWTKPRSIEGIAGAAGIGLGATGIFLVIDVALLQPLGVYTNRWLEVGGGSNWWYHPVWWQVGTFIPWMGAFILSAQDRRNGRVSPGAGMALVFALAIVLAAVAVLIDFPLAGWNLATFGVACLPGLALAALVLSLRARRG